MPFESLNVLENHAVLYYTLQQEAFDDLVRSLGESGWGADTTEGTLTFTSKTDPSRTIVANAEVLASIAPGPRSMLWGWGIPQGRPDGFAAQLRDYGVQQGIAELTEAEVPFPEGDIGDLSAWGLATAHQIGAAASFITGQGPYFAAPINGGAWALFLLTLNPALPPLTVNQTVVSIPRLLGATALTDPRAAVVGLAQLAGWTLVWADDQYSAATVNDGNSSATIAFDQLGRVTNVRTGS